MIIVLTADSTRRTVDSTLRVSNTHLHVGSERGVNRGPLRTTVKVKPQTTPAKE